MSDLSPEQETLRQSMVAAYLPHKDHPGLFPWIPLGWLVQPCVGSMPERRHLVSASPGYGVVCDLVTSNGSAWVIASAVVPGTVWVNCAGP